MDVTVSPVFVGQLRKALDHVTDAEEKMAACYRELEQVYRMDDAHPLVTVGHVHSRLGIAVARLQTARDQLVGVLQHVGRAGVPGGQALAPGGR